MSRVVHVGLIQASNHLNDESPSVADVQEAMFVVADCKLDLVPEVREPRLSTTTAAPRPATPL